MTNQKLKEEIVEHQRAESLLEGQKQVLEMIATGAPLAESLRALVLVIEAQAPSMMASILVLDRDGVHLRHASAPSLPPEYTAAIDGVRIGPTVGSCGTAAFLRQAVFVEDIATDPRWEEYRAVALPHGLRACWSVPIFDAPQILLGTFAMYYRQPGLPEAKHLRLIEIATHIASIAISRDRGRTALHESEVKLKEAQRLANMGYWERELATQRLTLSEETRRIFGLPSGREVLTEAEFRAMIHPDDRPVQLQAITEALSTGKSYNVEYRVVRPDGEVRFLHSWDEIVRDSAGRPIRMFGTVQDVTERKKRDEAVKESQKLLRLVLATLPVGVVVMNKVGDIVLTNSASKRIWSGVIVEGPERWQRAKGRWHDSGQPIAPSEWASVRALKDGELSLNELIDIVTFSGQAKTIQNSAAPILNADGEIVGAVIVNEDVTERVRGEELLRAKEEEIRAIVENSPDMIVRFDPNLRRTYVNAAFVKAQGGSKEHLLGGEIGSGATEGLTKAGAEQVAVMERSLKWVREHGRPLDFESTWPLPGDQRDFVVRMEPEFDARGALTSILVISRDVTELKANAAKLRQMEAELAEVSRLTMMGELGVAIAHEINQPLSAVANNANATLRWLSAVPPNLDETREAVRRIIRDTGRAAEVIARIRLLLKKGEPVRTSLNVNEVVENTVLFIEPELTRNQVNFEMELGSELPAVNADRVQLQQVLVNLLINALDSLRNITDRARQLRIRTRYESPDMVHVEVQDTGVGIGQAEAEQLFQAFFTTKPDGLGMGLAISRSIIEAHGGRLWASPHEGPGVTFHFTLPVQAGDTT